VPAAAATIALAEPIVELVYQYGSFGPSSTDEVTDALFWFAFSLPFAGINLLLTRTFFSLQRPWVPTALAGANLLVSLVLSLALYKPLGIAGPVIGTAVASAGMTFAQLFYLRRELHGTIEGRATAVAAVKVLAASALLALTSYGVWSLIEGQVGDAGALARAAAVLPALVAGAVVYAAAVQALRVPEAQQIRDIVTRRLRRG
jgi:putative peptidoglycan lipid II flippase